MSKFEKLTPAFQSETINQHRETALSQELGEADPTQQRLSEFVKLVAEADEEHPRVVEVLDVKGSPVYEEGDGTSLHVGVKTENRSRNTGIIIEGQFQGNTSSDVFDIYKVTPKGELFRADPDNFEANEAGYWKKVSLTAQKDGRRVSEAKQMLASSAQHGEDTLRRKAQENERKLELSRLNRDSIENSEMAGDVKAFEEFNSHLQDALHLKQRRVTRTPAQALEFKTERDRLVRQLAEYGLDFDLTSQLEGMFEASSQTIDSHRIAQGDIRVHKMNLEFARADSEKATALRKLNIHR